MKAISGAIILLAGTVLFGASVLADTMMVASRQSGNAPHSGIALLVSVGLVVIGFFVTVAGWSDRQQPPPTA